MGHKHHAKHPKPSHASGSAPKMVKQRAGLAAALAAGVVILVLLCLVAVLFYAIFN